MGKESGKLKRKNREKECSDVRENDIRTNNVESLGYRSSPRSIFPTNIPSLLTLLAEDDDDNRVTLVLDACDDECVLEDARVIAVLDNMVVLRCHDQFRFICIGCICEVIVDCEDILDELLESYSVNP